MQKFLNADIVLTFLFSSALALLPPPRKGHLPTGSES